jgi:hypothetical protein
MKNLIRFFSLILLMWCLIGFPILMGITSCQPHSNNISRYDKYKTVAKYKKGDIVYLKPDSIKVVVSGQCSCSKIEYNVYYFDKNKHKVILSVDEELIY